MAEQPVNLPSAIYLGVFSRAEQRVLQAIFKAIAAGSGRCVATLAMLARDSNTSKSTTRNAITQTVAIGLLEKTERRSYSAVLLPNILTYGQRWSARCPPSRIHDTAERIARHLGLTLRQPRSGNYRVNFRDGNETTAYYPRTISKTPLMPWLRWPVSERFQAIAELTGPELVALVS